MSEKSNLKAVMESESDMIQRIIGNTFIIDYGIIKALPAQGIATVEMSVADGAENIVITNCVLVDKVSTSLAVKVVPKIGDKVIVLFPKNYSSDMFSLSKNEVILSEVAKGYQLLGGLAIVANRFNENDYNNTIVLDDGSLEAKLNYIKPSSPSEQGYNNTLFDLKANGTFKFQTSYEKNKSKYKTVIELGENGNIEIKTAYDAVNDDYKTSVSIDGSTTKISVKDLDNDKSSEISVSTAEVSVTDCNGNTINTSDSGINLEDLNGNTITMDDSGIDMNGFLTVAKP